MLFLFKINFSRVVKLEYQDYGVPPPRQEEFGQNSYGNSGNKATILVNLKLTHRLLFFLKDYQSGNFNRGGGGNFSRGGSYG